jgi:hypothetical protein
MKKTVYGFITVLAAFVLGAGFYACDTGTLDNLISDPVYTVTAGGVFEHGSVAFAPAKAAAGETVIITVTPEAGYRLAEGSLRVNKGAVAVLGEGNVWWFTMPKDNVTVAAEFELLPADTYSVTVGVFANGSVAADPAAAKAGETVTLTVSPAAGYRLAEGSLTVNGGAVAVLGEGSVFTFTMPAGGVTVAAAFEALEAGMFSVTVGKFAGGSVAADPAFAAAGETVTLTVSPAAAHRLVAGSLTVSSGAAVSGSGNTWTFTMPASHVTVAAAFEELLDGFSVTVGALAGGKIATDKASAAAGETVTLTVTPAADYQFTADSLKVTDADGSAVAASGSGLTWTFTMPEDDVRVTAQFTAILYQVTMDSMSNGSVSASPASAAKGAKVTLTAKPGAGYQLAEDGLTVTRTDGGAVAVSGSGNTYTFTMPSGGATVAAAFETLPEGIYAVMIGDFTGGSVTANPASAEAGVTVTLTVTPAAEYQFTGTPSVTSDGKAVTVSGSGPYTFTMPAGNATVTAQFTVILYKVNIGTFTGGAVSANPANAAKDATVTLTVTQDTGYQLTADSLRVNNGAVTVNGSGNTYTFKMPSGGATVTAAFEAQEAGTYSVTIIQSPGGTIVADKLTAKQMETVTITVTPDPGYEYNKDLTVTRIADGSPALLQQMSGGKYTFNMYTGGVTVTATFTATPYTVYPSSPSHGTVISSHTTAIVGDEITVTATADAEYRLVGKPTVISSAGTPTVSGSGSTYTFTMPAGNATVTANFTAITYPVTDSSGAHGSVSGPASAAGAQVTLTVNADAGYQLKAGTLSVKNTSNGTVTPTPGSGNTWTFTMPSGGVMVEAEFETVAPSTYTITIDPSMTNGSVSPDPSGPVAAGTTVTLTVEPESGDYQLKAGSLKVNGSATGITGSGTTYTFNMPAANVTVAAEFVEAEVEVPEGYIAIDSATTLAMIGVDTENYPLNGKYFQTKDITITGTWTPIGAASGTAFTGEYDGNGKVITPNNVTFTSSEPHVGIFAYAKNAKFENIHIGEGMITSPGAVGGIVANAASTIINNCSNAADVVGAGVTGGICGYGDGITVTGCWNTGKITLNNTASYTVGGICGSLVLNSTTIKNCYNEGSVILTGTNTGTTHAGGIVGNMGGNNGIVFKIIACYNRGNVTTSSGKTTITAGGIVGNHSGGSSLGSIIACYNTGTVSTEAVWENNKKIYIGGITGTNPNNESDITACYNTGAVKDLTTALESKTGTAVLYLGGISGQSAWKTNGTATITDCFWNASATETNALNGIGYKASSSNAGAADDTGTLKFANDTWPVSTDTGWGIGNNSDSGLYWKDLGSYGGDYPRLWFEN